VGPGLDDDQYLRMNVQANDVAKGTEEKPMWEQMRGKPGAGFRSWSLWGPEGELGAR